VSVDPAPGAAVTSLDEGLWTVADVAAYLKISPRSVYELPGLPRVRVVITGRRALARYVPAEVRAWTLARLSRTIVQPGRHGSATRPAGGSRASGGLRRELEPPRRRPG
jgi:hypothetical protein